MASKVLLISTNRCVTPDPVFPLGLAHLNAALRQAGHETTWVDALGQAEALGQALARFQPDFVGLSLRNIDDVLIRKQETFFGELAGLIAQIRQHSRASIILGGSGFSLFPRRLLEMAGADFGGVGEGETALVALIAALERGENPGSIAGLVFRNNGGISTNPPVSCPLEQALEPEDWPEALTSHYLQTSGMLNLQTQRGCRFRCCYCTYPLIEGARHRRRPPEAVAAEFELLQRRGARYVFIVDSIFNSSPRHVTEVCEAILRRNIKLSWGCFLRPQGLTPELMALMARAGLSHIEFGSDSFCDEVLEAYHKDFTFADILRSNELARQAHVDACHFLICGGPGESIATLRTTFENSRRLAAPIVMAVVGMRIYPGTALFERAAAEGCVSPETELLTPAYYLAPGLNADSVFKQLQEFAGVSPNWIVGDPAPAYTSLVARLRQRGVAGPLWAYFSMIQRLWPQGFAGRTSP
jgi:radical SAM superfamily enzyme YgiQ (UPF0313 family)